MKKLLAALMLVSSGVAAQQAPPVDRATFIKECVVGIGRTRTFHGMADRDKQIEATCNKDADRYGLGAAK